jgi:activator of 2-hydroxyglutaryl-CoA dehydratase
MQMIIAELLVIVKAANVLILMITGINEIGGYDNRALDTSNCRMIP